MFFTSRSLKRRLVRDGISSIKPSWNSEAKDDVAAAGKYPTESFPDRGILKN